MSKPSAFAKAVQREVEKRISEYTRVRMQMAQDAAFITANEVLHLGPTRAKVFGETFCRVVNELAVMIVDENFVPFDQRYGGGNGK